MKNWIFHNLWIITLRADNSRMRCAAACITTHTFLSSTSIFVRSNIATWSTSRPWKCSISDKGRFQTLFPKSVKFSNFDKLFGASYFSSKITPKARIWAAYTLRGRRYSQKTFVKYPEGKVPRKMKNCQNFYHH